MTRSKVILVFMLFIAVLLLISAEVLAVDVIGIEAPENSDWCWAASIECVSKFYGQGFIQCDVAENVCWGHSYFCGRLIRTLLDDFKKIGNYSIKWNGMDNRKRPVASGVYFYRLKTDQFTATKKMVLLR